MNISNYQKYKIALNTIAGIKEDVFSGNWRKTFRHECFTEKFVEVVSNSKFFIDAGAEFGFYSWLAIKYMPQDRRIVLFEPEPERFFALRQAMEDYSEVTVLPYALAEKRKNIKMHKETINHSCTMDGFLSQSQTDRACEIFEVEAVALDEYFVDDFEGIDLIKMDIEGAEVLALKGMENILAKSRAKIFLEFHGAYVQSIMPGGGEYIRNLFKKNYYEVFYCRGLSCVPSGLDRGRVYLKSLRRTGCQLLMN